MVRWSDGQMVGAKREREADGGDSRLALPRLHHLRTQKEPQLSRSPLQLLDVDPDHPALGDSPSARRSLAGEEQACEVLHPGRMTDQRDDGSGPGSPMSSARRARSGLSANASQGTGGLDNCSSADQDLRGFARRGPRGS